jgi:hydroxymethylglutaryl-CoA synthase
MWQNTTWSRPVSTRKGAGAVAVLVKQKPRLLAFSSNWGTATRSVHDFFKPVQMMTRQQLLEEIVHLVGEENLNTQAILERWADAAHAPHYTLHRETPVFDGPYSNACYQQRIREALSHFAANGARSNGEALITRWERILFHLPYAFQARRMFAEIYLDEAQRSGVWKALKEELGMDIPQASGFEDEKAYQKAYAGFLKAITKTQQYRSFVARTIAPSERASSLVGNIYTGSIFLGLMSSLETDLAAQESLAGKRFGFFAYGSGSKAKVFEGEVQSDWMNVTRSFQLFDRLEARQAISYETYEAIHLGTLNKPAQQDKKGFVLQDVCMEPGVRMGARTYGMAKVGEKVAV